MVAHRAFDPDVFLLDQDTDEVLLALLARDAEPPLKHDIPHRRWKYPPGYDDRPDREGPLGRFSRVKPGWWQVTSWDEVYRRQREEQERFQKQRKQQEKFENGEQHKRFEQRQQDALWEYEWPQPQEELGEWEKFYRQYRTNLRARSPSSLSEWLDERLDDSELRRIVWRYRQDRSTR
jgi:hypothetical protein